MRVGGGGGARAADAYKWKAFATHRFNLNIHIDNEAHATKKDAV